MSNSEKRVLDAERREAIRVQLAELEMENGGRLTPSAVVEAAKNPSSPMHGCFEWDSEKAAYQYQLDQARELITSVHVVQHTETTKVRTVFYVRDPSAASKDQGYVSVETLKSESEMARAAIVAEFSAVADRLRRAKHLAQALGAEDDVEELIETVLSVRGRFKEPKATAQSSEVKSPWNWRGLGADMQGAAGH